MMNKFRAALAVAMFSLTLAGCFSESMYSMNEKASRQLSPEMVSLIEKKGMTKESPILVRIFKEESELEVWKQTSEGKYDLLKTYPICRWSGDLGPKIKTGDRQAPEGFYMITPGLMNPNSSYYLSFNTGFPNAFDRSLNRTGSNLMVHGDCSSAGCYAMTDEQIGEIFALAREAFTGGQRAFQVQAYPIRSRRASRQQTFRPHPAPFPLPSTRRAIRLRAPPHQPHHLNRLSTRRGRHRRCWRPPRQTLRQTTSSAISPAR
jgi:murein L,D-transpeptidase YafK